MEYVIRDFIESWKTFNGFTGTNEEAVKKINSGDCGLAAIAISLVMTSRHAPVTIMMNESHSWVLHQGIEYDTLHPGGYLSTIDEVWESKVPPVRLTLEEAANEWMPCDALGAYLLQGFLQRYEIAMPECLLHCLDNPKYDSLENIAKYKASSDLVANRTAAYYTDNKGDQIIICDKEDAKKLVKLLQTWIDD